METSEKIIVTDDTKEACAIETMRFMLQDYAEEKGISFEEALLSFTTSTTYAALFDFDTAVWMEGPAYLRAQFEKTMIQA